MFAERAPHYIREYKRLLETLKKRHPGDEAMHRAVGGAFEDQGAKQAELVLSLSPEGPFTLMDVGCGSGRAASALRDVERLSYWGVDIMPELLAHAKKVANRPDWRFEPVTDIALPADDNWADMALVMSVFTHLKNAEIKTYLEELARVIKPGGVLICSYLDRNHAPHRKVSRPMPLQRLGRLLGRDVMVSFTTRDELSAWVEDAGFAIEQSIQKSELGQHILIGRRQGETS